MSEPTSNSIIIVMGVSGCGKSTIAALIGEALSITFLDADDLHPPENKQLMSAGIALSDENRFPWLHTVRDYAINCSSKNESCVIACSALKRAYRDVLNQAPNVCYVFLDGPRSLIHQRMVKRSGHFMPETLLDSQFEALERPHNKENVVTISIDSGAKHIAQEAIAALRRAHYLPASTTMG